METVDEREFTDREKELAFLYRVVERARNRMGSSYAIIARKGMGKTAILERFYNRLFVEQEEVVPFYISFAEFGGDGRERLSLRRFMRIYLRELVAQYVAFHLRDGGIVRADWRLKELLEVIRRHRDSIPMAEMVERYVGYGLEDGDDYWEGLSSVVQFTRQVLGHNDRSPGVLMIDEFQVLTEVWDEGLGKYVDVAQMYQKTAEARWCPMVVTGSAVSLITRTVMGGLLARRFGPYHLGPFEEGATVEYAARLAELNGVGLGDGVAYGIHRLTGGNPHYIWCLVSSDKAAEVGLETPEQLYTVYEYEMNDPNGKLRGFWDTHFLEYADKINGSGLALKVLYHLATMEEETVTLREIVERFGGEMQEALRVMQQLRQADLVEVFSSQLFYRITDPVLVEYIRREYRASLEELDVYRTEFMEEYHRRLGSLNNVVGRAAELFVVGLLARFDGQEVDGVVFGEEGPCRLPRFEKVRNRSGIIIEGERVELDVVAEGEEMWLVEVKHWQRPVGAGVVERFAERVQEWDDGVVPWLLSLGGLTAGARERARELGIRHSDREDFNRLADAVGYVHFPTVSSVKS